MTAPSIRPAHPSITVAMLPPDGSRYADGDKSPTTLSKARGSLSLAPWLHGLDTGCRAAG
ncbi:MULTISPECIES: hypothetical protein [Nocardiaceae]|uniref:Uncharacterized protein n=1 Tax=Rhodococcoides kroppenstedtii TaxID=293050 RepID=A0ABS7NPJ3_9NOCA|nr:MULTISPECIES: hypothetical protein [Rhodococcus]AMY18020.1 hypothetical protein A3Q40_00612 [Rhodococcus sp. PBTS 1]MBY6313644.1 hypothetical protein [Rhodococcus kroppenstedtii]MBY6319933.1 hypothetical protein [Rhodococcus kroppenstedtii]MBY6398872.1 hypothetical protein [Rhodococcus kroppenstedtii]